MVEAASWSKWNLSTPAASCNNIGRGSRLRRRGTGCGCRAGNRDRLLFVRGGVNSTTRLNTPFARFDRHAVTRSHNNARRMVVLRALYNCSFSACSLHSSNGGLHRSQGARHGNRISSPVVRISQATRDASRTTNNAGESARSAGTRDRLA